MPQPFDSLCLNDIIIIITIIIRSQPYMAFDLHQIIPGFSIFDDLAPISQLYIL